MMYTLITDPVYFYSFIPAIIGGAAALAGGLVGGFMNRKSQSSANKVNIQLAREQQQFEQKMVQMQNEYNSPVAQMKRYADAGLNPNLVYSQGNPGNQTSLPSYQRADVKPAQFNFQQDMANAVAQIYNNLQSTAQIRKLNAEASGQEIDNMVKFGSWENQMRYDISRYNALDEFYRNPEYFLKNKDLQNKLLNEQYGVAGYNTMLKQMEFNFMNANDIGASLYPESDGRSYLPNYQFVYRGNYDYKQAMMNSTLANMALLPYKAASLRAGTSLKKAQINAQNMLVRKMDQEVRKLSLMNKDPRYYYSNGSFLDKAGLTMFGGAVQGLGHQIDRFVDWLESLVK